MSVICKSSFDVVDVFSREDDVGIGSAPMLRCDMPGSCSGVDTGDVHVFGPLGTFVVADDSYDEANFRHDVAP